MAHHPKIYIVIPLMVVLGQTAGAAPSFRPEPPQERRENGPPVTHRSAATQARGQEHAGRPEAHPEHRPDRGEARHDSLLKPERHRAPEPLEGRPSFEPRHRIDPNPVQPNPRPSRSIPLEAPIARSVPPPLRSGPISGSSTYSAPTRSLQQSRAWWEGEGWRRGAWQPHATWRDHRSNRWEADHRSWSQRGGYGGYFIPRNEYLDGFGSRHCFRMSSRPSIFRGYPRFWYRNYWFIILDPWPLSWGEDWYLDDVYVEYYLDGYYLFSPRHPGMSLAIAVSI